MANTWYDNTGLYRKYGTTKAVANTAGEYRTYGNLREVQVKIDLTTLTQSEVIQSDVQVIPSGVRIQEVEVQTITASATGTAIDIGLIKTDRTTEIDYDGLAAAFPQASMDPAGDQTILTEATTYNGALIGTTTAYTGHITASRTDGTAFTAGVVLVTIRYFVP